MNNITTPYRYQGSRLALLDPSMQKKVTVAKTGGGDRGFQIFGSDGFTFSDFIDIINPLQHIPLVSTFYRNATGDTIDPGSRILGGALFGGPIGAIASIINVAVGEATGTDIGEHALALFSDKPPQTIDSKFAGANPLANFESASGLPGKDAYAAPTGAEVAVLESERIKALAETYPSITGAEIKLLKAESRETANIAETKTKETKAEAAIPRAAARAKSRLTGWPPSPVADQMEVLDWARKESQIAARKQALPDRATTAAIAAPGGWFAEANYVAAASYRHGAELRSAAKTPIMNILE